MDAHDKQSVDFRETVGSFMIDHDKDFRDSVARTHNTVMESHQLDIFQDLKSILMSPTVMENYKEELIGDIMEESSLNDDVYLAMMPEKMEQLFENTAEHIVHEAFDGAMLPIVGFSLPILKKAFLQCHAKDIVMTEVPQQPIVKVAFERKFLKDRDGNKHYIPEIFYNDDYKEIMNEAHGKQIPTKWYPEGSDDPIQVKEIDLLAEAGGSIQLRDSISPNFYIDAVRMMDGGEEIIVEGVEVRPERATGGTFAMEISGTNQTTGEQVKDIVTGKLDYYSGKIAISCTAGKIVQVRFNGRLSNQNNTQTIELDREREARTWEIPHGPHINTGLTIENLKDMKALHNIDVAAEAITDMSTTMTQYEDSDILDFVLSSFDRWEDRTDLPFGFTNGFTETYEFDMVPPSHTVLPTSEWAHDIKWYINRQVDSLKEKIKSEELMFVIAANPAHISIFQDSVQWMIEQDSTVGGIRMEYSFGVMSRTQSRMHVVSSMKIPRDAGIRIIAFPTSANNITFKHYKYSMNIRNDFRNALTPLTPNIMSETRFLTTEVLPVQGKMNIRNDSFGRLTKVK